LSQNANHSGSALRNSNCVIPAQVGNQKALRLLATTISYWWWLQATSLLSNVVQDFHGRILLVLCHRLTPVVYVQWSIWSAGFSRTFHQAVGQLAEATIEVRLKPAV